MTDETLVAGIAIAFLAAVCQSVTGFGFALVMTPLLTLAWDAKLAVATSLIVSPISVAMMLPEVHARIPLPRVSMLFLGFLAGMPLGTFLLQRLDADSLRVAIAAVVIAAAALMYVAPAAGGSRDGFFLRVAVGAVSGAVGASTSMGGPPVVLYLLGRETDVDTFRATTLALFLPTSLLAFAAAALVGVVTTDVLVIAALSVPSVALGLTLGRAARRRLHPDRFRAVVVTVLVVTSIAVLVSAAGAIG